MPFGDDAREWKEGGGEAGGHCWPGCSVWGESSSSWAATWINALVLSLRKQYRGFAQSHGGRDGPGQRTLS